MKMPAKRLIFVISRPLPRSIETESAGAGVDSSVRVKRRMTIMAAATTAMARRKDKITSLLRVLLFFFMDDLQIGKVPRPFGQGTSCVVNQDEKSLDASDGTW